MEKTWEDFAATGKVTDYLKYRLARRMNCEAAAEWPDEKEREDERVRRVDRHGAYRHADW
jgi:hypothetical protein